MSDVFYLRPIDPPITPDDVQGMSKYASGCFNLHRVEWKHSFLSADGRRMLCWYCAPDAESARVALRTLGSDMNAVWAGTVMGEGSKSTPISAANLIAEVSFAAPLGEHELALRISALERQAVTLVRGFLSSRGTRWLGALETSDAAAARAALERAELPAEAIWACTPLTPKRQD